MKNNDYMAIGEDRKITSDEYINGFRVICSRPNLSEEEREEKKQEIIRDILKVIA